MSVCVRERERERERKRETDRDRDIFDINYFITVYSMLEICREMKYKFLYV